MGKLNVTLLDATGTREQEASLPDDAPIYKIMSKLITMLQLPAAGPDGQPIVYKFHHKASGRQLNGDQNLIEAGVTDGDVLRIQPEITAG